MNRNTMNKKIYFAFGLICLVFFVFLARVIQLQIFKHKEYLHYAESLSIKDIPDYPTRGVIYDRNMNQLTKNQKTYDYWITATDINYNALEPEDQDKVKEEFRKINDIVDIDLEQIDKLLSEGFSSYRIARFVPSEKAEKIDALKIRWLASYEVYKRVYTFDYLASHVIGSVDTSNHGILGLEYYMDQELAGVMGKKVAKTDRAGNELALQDVKKYEAKNGSHVVTTIDTVIEQYVRNALDKAAKKYKPDHLIAIVMESKTGEILAMESYPTFNLNDKTEVLGIPTQGLQDEEKTKIWYGLGMNMAISWLYEPGSVSKLITTAIGLEENIFNEEVIKDCGPGFMEISDAKLHCWVYPGTHGKQDLQMALANSCNPAYIQLGLSIGPKIMMDYMYAFGLPYRTGIDLPGENHPLFPARKDMNKVANATMSYGHGYVVTPLQMLTAVNAIANDGKLVQPHIIKKVIDDEGNIIKENKTKVLRQVLSKQTSDRMKVLMEGVGLTYVGDMAPSSFKGIRYGCKTGSSVKFDREKGEYTDNTILSFFLTAPITDPKYSVLVIMDNSKEQTSSVGGTGGIARDIILDIYDYDRAALTQEESEQSTVPDVTNLPLESAIDVLESEGFLYTLVNYKEDKEEDEVQRENQQGQDLPEPPEESDEVKVIENQKAYFVEEQFPKPGNLVGPGTNIILNLGEKEIE